MWKNWGIFSQTSSWNRGYYDNFFGCRYSKSDFSASQYLGPPYYTSPVYWKSDNVQIAFKYTRFKSFLELIYFVNQIGINAELVSGLLSLVTYVGTYWTRMTITCVWWFHGKQKRHNVLLCKHLCIPINQFCSEVILSCSHMSNSMNCYHITLRSSNFWVTWNALIDVNITLIVRW